MAVGVALGLGVWVGLALGELVIVTVAVGLELGVKDGVAVKGGIVNVFEGTGVLLTPGEQAFNRKPSKMQIVSILGVNWMGRWIILLDMIVKNRLRSGPGDGSWF